ncbi:hypothetical protein BDV38DRAFT_88160 [Aspergillus pseudotamarii]|uniref:Uncharacterized protein n=1 Tax=Aspergillus pseudotamarii TaxID=132259 RepID=A0A5N6SRG7_ASPPS|nr:uncharacterized protein BDV38DRAFT_88160 [Aspergillus pseudotamarii]KAE8137278.1 hypothetical protein BDV38DRAFT_88160 [Aspergillus pseudotamarii]
MQTPMVLMPSLLRLLRALNYLKRMKPDPLINFSSSPIFPLSSTRLHPAVHWTNMVVTGYDAAGYADLGSPRNSFSNSAIPDME